jgi:hypothetical protein
MYYAKSKNNRVRTTVLPVGVESTDVIKLRNTVNSISYNRLSKKKSDVREEDVANYSEELIEKVSERLKLTNAEFKNFSNEETIILSKKRDHLNGIKRGIVSALATISGVGIWASVKNPLFMMGVETTRENSEDIAKMFCDFFEPDFTIAEDDDEREEKKVIISPEDKKSIASLLKKFKVPDAISVDVEHIYTNGPTFTVFYSLVSNVFEKYSSPSSKIDSSGMSDDFA